MRWVDRPHRAPHRCALNPTRGQMTPGRWLDLGPLGPPGFEQHAYAHEASLREAARDMLGWHPPSVVKGRDAQIAELREELAVRLRELHEARAQVAAYDVVIRTSTSSVEQQHADFADAAMRQERAKAAKLEALARGRATAAANRAAKAREEATT